MGTDSPWLKMNWAEIYDQEKRYDEAAQLYSAVINSNTKNVKAKSQAYGEMCTYYVMKNNIAKAEELHKAHVELEPQNAWARGNYAANLLYIAGDFDRAIVHAREALTIMDYGNAKHTLAIALYGKWAMVWINERDKERSQKYFDEARKLYPDLAKVGDETMGQRTTQIVARAINVLSEVQKRNDGPDGKR
jgi:tetratricopeptide (TPR) repeat protein